jgi:hypothetical protein
MVGKGIDAMDEIHTSRTRSRVTVRDPCWAEIASQQGRSGAPGTPTMRFDRDTCSGRFMLAPASSERESEVSVSNDDEKSASAAARELSRLGASKGGSARAQKLTPAERSKIARDAVRTRWAKEGKDLAAPQEVHTTLPYSMFRGPLSIGDVEFEGHVLNDLRRVLTQGAVVRVLTGGTDSSNLGRYLRRLSTFNDDDRRPYYPVSRAGQPAGGNRLRS